MNYTTYSSRVPNSQEGIDPAFSFDVGTAPASIGQIPEINDGAIPNLSGRVAPDTDGMRSKLLSCRNHAFISSFNTRTLNPSSRLSELVLNAKLHKIDIIAIQEHRFFHPDDAIKYHKSMTSILLLLLVRKTHLMHLLVALAFSCHPGQWRTCPKWKLSHHKL